MRATSVAIAIAALFLGACGNNDIDVNKSRTISNPPSTPSSAMESMSGKVDEAADSAMEAAEDVASDTAEMAKDTMDAAEEMVADADGADMMDKAKEMAEDSGVMEKAEEMVEEAGGADVMDKAKEMMADADGADMMDKAEEMVADADGADMMEKAEEMVAGADGDSMMDKAQEAGSALLIGGGAAEAVEETMEEIAEEAPAAMASVSMEEGKALGNKSGCFACHNIDRKVLGPAWKDVAARYADDKAAGRVHLLNKIAKGGKGVWADAGINAAMPPYSPRVSDENIEILTDFILGL